MSEGQINELTTSGRIIPIIKKFIKRNNMVLHGGRAINARVGFPFRRFSRDFDLFITKGKPKEMAKRLEKKLEEARGGDFHYVKPARGKTSTFKLMDKGLDEKRGTEDDFGWADFERKPKGLKTEKIGDFNFVPLEHIRKTKIRLVKDPKFEFRRKNDLQDLNTINLFLKSKKAKGGKK